MLEARLKVLSIAPGSDSGSSLVTVGIALEETDPAFSAKLVGASIDWGDGVEEQIIKPRVSPYQSSSSPKITRVSNVVTLTLDPEPFRGSFNLSFNGVDILGLAYDVNRKVLGKAIKDCLSPGEDVTVTGSSPEWKISFPTEALAAGLAVGSDDLDALRKQPARLYSAGNYVITLIASNQRHPDRDVKYVSVPLELQPLTEKVPPSPVIFGPILPADVGYPNKDQWSFHSGSDLKALVSNVKMILITEPGDRLMIPEYGCALRQFLFDPNDFGAEQDVTDEIRRAITAWEPRVHVENIAVKREDSSMFVTVLGVSTLNRERFQLNVELER